MVSILEAIPNGLDGLGKAAYRALLFGLVAWTLHETVQNGKQIAALEEHVAAIDRMIQADHTAFGGNK